MINNPASKSLEKYESDRLSLARGFVSEANAILGSEMPLPEKVEEIDKIVESASHRLEVASLCEHYNENRPRLMRTAKEFGVFSDRKRIYQEAADRLLAEDAENFIPELEEILANTSGDDVRGFSVSLVELLYAKEGRLSAKQIRKEWPNHPLSEHADAIALAINKSAGS